MLGYSCVVIQLFEVLKLWLVPMGCDHSFLCSGASRSSCNQEVLIKCFVRKTETNCHCAVPLLHWGFLQCRISVLIARGERILYCMTILARFALTVWATALIPFPQLLAVGSHPGNHLRLSWSGPRLTSFVCHPQELKATNEALRALQLQLEKAYHTQQASAPPNSTLTAILETKDARITTLEKEVALLEQELDRIRECGVLGPARAVLMASPTLDLEYATNYPKLELTFKRQVSASKFFCATKRPLSWDKASGSDLRAKVLVIPSYCS